MKAEQLEKLDELWCLGPQFSCENDEAIAESMPLFQLYQKHEHIAETIINYLSISLYRDIIKACSNDQSFLKHINDSGEVPINIEYNGVKCWWLDCESPMGEINFGEKFSPREIICYINIETPYEPWALGLSCDDFKDMDQRQIDSAIENERHGYRKDHRENPESFILLKLGGSSFCTNPIFDEERFVQPYHHAISNTLRDVSAIEYSQI